MSEPLRCRGMYDMLPAHMERFRWVEEVFRRTCLAWGYREVRTPTVEHLFLFTATGTLTPQALGRVYSFLDWDGWSGERVVLRPEGTIPTARLYVEHLSGEPLAKLFYVQNVFHFAEGEARREEWQAGVELIGDTQPLGDVELVLVAHQALSSLGLDRIGLRLSHPGLVRAVLARTGLPPEDQLSLYDGILEGDAEALARVRQRIPELGAPPELLLAEEGQGLAFLRNLRSVFLPVLPELEAPMRELEEVVAALEELGLTPTLSGALVRHYEYYTGPVFRFEVDGRLVGAGGRYDSLIGLLGGRDVPASGFALYLGEVLDLVEPPRPSEVDVVWVQTVGRRPQDVAEAFLAVRLLRERGRGAQVVLSPSQAGVPRLLLGDGRYRVALGGGQEREAASLEEALALLTQREGLP
ncbi:MAG TPA: ATP phosphoribosyltransferase regulatory subunit [Dehalococcoidia bacterium]|nr:ATP phosphoribosyltransferase regulatory subunit [Dehalococcoidia bacterium]